MQKENRLESKPALDFLMDLNEQLRPKNPVAAF
jgi:hypothetical protein